MTSPAPLPAAAPLQGIYASAPAETASRELKTAAAREARLKVIAAAEKYQGSPYRYGGLDAAGFDCSGLVFRSFRDALAVSIPRSTVSLHTWAEKITDEKIQPGDLLFFKTTGSGSITHVGIYAGEGRFIHSASEGPRTGVIYSRLDEAYWRRTYAGAGRALPEVYADFPGSAIAAGSTGGETAAPGSSLSGSPQVYPEPGTVHPGNPQKSGAGEEKWIKYRIGLGLAPSWNGFLENGFVLRGAAAQIRAAAETRTFSKPLLIGIELRPEWDHTMGVFRLPVTVSLGFNDKLRLFAGPALSFGDPVLRTSGERHYTGGTSWLGAVGLTVAPFSFAVPRGDLAPYAELAWQSYFRDNEDSSLNADFAAGLRFSTGLRYNFHFEAP